MLLEISIILLVAGIIFKVFTPKNRNFIYGYRTRLSRLSQANWDEAQKYSSTLLISISLILLVLGVIFKLITFKYEIGITVIIIIGSLTSIFVFTERHLVQK